MKFVSHNKHMYRKLKTIPWIKKVHEKNKFMLQWSQKEQKTKFVKLFFRGCTSIWIYCSVFTQYKKKKETQLLKKYFQHEYTNIFDIASRRAIYLRFLCTECIIDVLWQPKIAMTWKQNCAILRSSTRVQHINTFNILYKIKASWSHKLGAGWQPCLRFLRKGYTSPPQCY